MFDLPTDTKQARKDYAKCMFFLIKFVKKAFPVATMDVF